MIEQTSGPGTWDHIGTGQICIEHLYCIFKTNITGVTNNGLLGVEAPLTPEGRGLAGRDRCGPHTLTCLQAMATAGSFWPYWAASVFFHALGHRAESSDGGNMASITLSPPRGLP